MKDHYPSRVSAEPSIMERKDPVVYSSETDAGPLRAEQVVHYQKEGYLFLDEFLSKEEVHACRRELASIWNQSIQLDAPEVIREPESQEIRSVFAVHQNSDVIGKLARNERLLAIVRQILGSDVYIHQSRINYKPGFSGKEFYWHSDFETWHVEDGMPRMRALSCSIALEDNYHFNGPLMVMPGSHQYFVSCVGATPDDHYKQSLRRQEYGVPDQDSLKQLSENGGIQAPTGRAGSVVLFDCNVMHGSNSNITPYPRSNVFIVYNSVENALCEPFSGKSARPSFIASRDRQ